VNSANYRSAMRDDGGSAKGCERTFIGTRVNGEVAPKVVATERALPRLVEVRQRW
jgi:hypothetical protein